jgi:hypothetical protein
MHISKYIQPKSRGREIRLLGKQHTFTLIKRLRVALNSLRMMTRGRKAQSDTHVTKGSQQGNQH